MEYMFEFDTFDSGCFVEFLECDEWTDVIIFAHNELAACGGGHCDIYDDEENFVSDYEV